MNEHYFYLQTKPIKKITKEKNTTYYWYQESDYLKEEEYIFIHHFICIANSFYKNKKSIEMDELIRYTINFVNKYNILNKKEVFYLKHIVIKAIDSSYIKKIAYTKSEELYLSKEDIPKFFYDYKIKTPFGTDLKNNKYYLTELDVKKNNYFIEHTIKELEINKYTHLFFSVIQNNLLIINAYEDFLTIGKFLFLMTEKELFELFMELFVDNHLNYSIERSFV